MKKTILSCAAILAIVLASLTGCSKKESGEFAPVPVGTNLGDTVGPTDSADPAPPPPVDDKSISLRRQADALEKLAAVAALPMLANVTVSTMRDSCKDIPVLERDVKAAIAKAYGTEHKVGKAAEEACEAAKVACESAEVALFEAGKLGVAAEREAALMSVQSLINEATTKVDEAKAKVQTIKGRPVGDPGKQLGASTSTNDPCFDQTRGVDGRTFAGRYPQYCPSAIRGRE